LPIQKYEESEVLFIWPKGNEFETTFELPRMFYVINSVHTEVFKIYVTDHADVDKTSLCFDADRMTQQFKIDATWQCLDTIAAMRY